MGSARRRRIERRALEEDNLIIALGLTGINPILDVSKSGSGSGTVTSSPAGINCGSTCSEDYDYNTVVTLTAAAATGSTFSGWSGACTGTNTTCTLTMDGDKSTSLVIAGSMAAISAVIDASNLPYHPQNPGVDVLNGIAYIPERGTFLVTGKFWPELYEVRWQEASEPADFGKR